VGDGFVIVGAPMTDSASEGGRDDAINAASDRPQAPIRWSRRPLWRSGPLVGPLGFGAFKIGRNEGIKYQRGYALPDETSASALLRGVLGLGIDLIDTAPAYGASEARIGRHLNGSRDRFTLITKVGESFEDGRSTYAYDADSIRRSVDTSIERLGGPPDLLLLHSDGRDLEILRDTDAVRAMERARDGGLVRAIGMSAKSDEGTIAALPWAESVMVEYHIDRPQSRAVLEAAAERGVGTIVKKGLASGRLPAAEAIRFVLACDAVDTLAVGGLSLEHLASNIAVATRCRPAPAEST